MFRSCRWRCTRKRRREVLSESRMREICQSGSMSGMLAHSSIQNRVTIRCARVLRSRLAHAFVSRAGCNVRPTVPLLPALFGKALIERTKIDHNSLVGSAADLLIAVACRHFEVNSFSLDVDYLGRRPHLVAYRRGSEVFYIY